MSTIPCFLGHSVCLLFFYLKLNTFFQVDNMFIFILGLLIEWLKHNHMRWFFSFYYCFASIMLTSFHESWCDFHPLSLKRFFKAFSQQKHFLQHLIFKDLNSWLSNVTLFFFFKDCPCQVIYTSLSSSREATWCHKASSELMGMV